MKALVLDFEIVQIELEEFPVAPTLEWVDISGITPVPEVGWSYDGVTFTPPLGPTLIELKSNKTDNFVTEGIIRIAAQVPDWDTIESIKTVAGLWDSHLAGNATAAQINAKDIYLYVRDTVPSKLAAVTTQAQLDAIDPTAANPFGDAAWPS